MLKENKFFTAKNVAILGVLSAFVVVAQVFGSYFKIGAVSLSFVLVPIVLGAITTGIIGGTFLGLVFGATTFLMGLNGADYFTSVLISDHFVITLLVCLVKGAAAGTFSGIVYRILRDKNDVLATAAAAAIAPIANTGLFILGALLMTDTLNANFVGDNSSVIYFLFIGCAGVNFLIEFAINVALAPTLSRIIKAVKRSF